MSRYTKRQTKITVEGCGCFLLLVLTMLATLTSTIVVTGYVTLKLLEAI